MDVIIAIKKMNRKTTTIIVGLAKEFRMSLEKTKSQPRHTCNHTQPTPKTLPNTGIAKYATNQFAVWSCEGVNVAGKKIKQAVHVLIGSRISASRPRMFR